MRNSIQKEIPSLLERFELKYLIPESMVDPISNFASIYCDLDKYSEKSRDGFYSVNSLYLDSPGFLFLNKRMSGAENRFNMRIRSYDSRSGIPCFLEIKQKRSGISKKFRAAVFDENWHRLFDTPGYALRGDMDGDSASKRDLFLRVALSHNAEPKILTSYRRKAYISNVDDYARVTFDKELRYQPETRYNLIPDEGIMVPYDNSANFDPECSVILELKCITTQVPQWFLDLIAHFNLERGSFSKYVTSMRESLQCFSPHATNRVPAWSVPGSSIIPGWV